MSQSTTHFPTEMERERIQQIIEKHNAERPNVVRRVGLTFGEDSTENPAAYIALIVGKDVNPTKELIEELNDYAQVLVNDIANFESDILPYVRTVIEE
jgi:hypothetical protein